MVELLEAHLAELNTALALNTMALAAFGLTTTALPQPVPHQEDRRSVWDCTSSHSTPRP